MKFFFSARKYAVGIVAGVVLMYSGQALAGTISKVGKKVQAEYEVVVDGKVLDAKAWAIDGQTNSPNRALGNEIGYDVSFKNNQIIWTKRVGESLEKIPIESSSEQSVEMTPDDIESVRSSEEQITLAEQRIKRDKDRLSSLEDDLSKAQIKLNGASENLERQLIEGEISGIKSSIEAIKEGIKMDGEGIESQKSFIDKTKAKYVE